MAQPSKFSGALSRLREAPATEQPVETPPPAPVVQEGAKGRGRPHGKRSDPDFKPTTLLLREQTKRTAVRLLEDSRSGQDLSELVEQLLTQWNKRQV